MLKSTVVVSLVLGGALGFDFSEVHGSLWDQLADMQSESQSQDDFTNLNVFRVPRFKGQQAAAPPEIAQNHRWIPYPFNP